MPWSRSAQYRSDLPSIPGEEHQLGNARLDARHSATSTSATSAVTFRSADDINTSTGQASHGQAVQGSPDR